MKNLYEYKNKVAFLKNSLSYQMSLGSKELFHSNVWAWLIEQDPEFIKVFFPAFDKARYTFLGVSRECKNRDIIIWLEKQCDEKNKQKYYLVIENKIKSLQRQDQLEAYTEDLWDNTLLQGVVTGIENALDKDEIELYSKTTGKKVIWKFIDYSFIALNIRRTAQSSSKVAAHLSQIIEYCDIIEHINDLIRFEIKRTENTIDYCGSTYKGADEKKKEYLADLRIKDIYIKLKGSQILKALEDRLEYLRSSTPPGYKLEINQSFHNGKATLDIRYTNKEKSDDYLTLGVQLEEHQYRLIVERDSRHSSKELFDKLSGIWFDGAFDEKAKSRKLFGYDTPMKKKYDKYWDAFVYQYFNIFQWNYNDVFAQIEKDLEQARCIIASNQFD